MRIGLVSPPRPGGRFINRDLFGGMAIDDHFGTDPGASFVAFLKAEGTVIPEIVFPYLAALLRGHEVRFLDGARADPAEAAALECDLRAFRPDWVVASSSFANLKNEAAFLERVGMTTGARTVLFGEGATQLAAEVLARHALDFVVDGDAEAVVPALVAANDPTGVPGTWRRDGRHGVAHSGRRIVEDLDTLPFPDWDATPLARYRYFPLLKKRPFLTLSSSRGCTYGCRFCPYPVAQGHAFRARTAGSVVDELAHVVARFGARSVLFRDPNFALDRARTLAICHGIVQRGVRLDWGCETRLDLLDDEVIQALARAGCRSVEFGMDSLSDEAARQNNRRTITPDEARARVKALTRHRIASAALFVFGLPGDTPEAMAETIRFANGLGLSYANYQVPVPFPGTALYDRAVAEGWMDPIGLDDLTGTQPRLPTSPDLPADRLRALQSEALRSFYVRPGRLLFPLRDGEPGRSAWFLASTAARFAAGRLSGRGRPGRGPG